MTTRQILVTAPKSTLTYLVRAIRDVGVIDLRVLEATDPPGDPVLLILADAEPLHIEAARKIRQDRRSPPYFD